MSTLVWTPAANDARTVRVTWHAAPRPYTLHWGDGDQTECDTGATPVTHTYAAAGTYDVVAVAERDFTAATRVTVRDWATPPVPGSSVDGNIVTLTFPQVSAPVQWHVDWGHNDATSTSTGDAVDYTYPWDYGEPDITVTDVPSKRRVRFTGPAIEPSPGPLPDLPVNGFLVRYLRTSKEGPVFELLAGQRPVGEQVWFYPRRSWSSVVPLVADSRGKIQHEFMVPKNPNGPAWDDAWRSYSLKHSQGWEFLPVQPVAMRADQPQVTYRVSPTAPLDVTISVYPPQPGVHYVEWGDGYEARINAAELPLRASHNYGYKRPDRPIRVFLPDGRYAQRWFDWPDPCPPAYNPVFPGEATITWKRHGGSCGGDTDGFAPVYVDNGGAHPPHVLHRPTNSNDTGTAYLYTGLSLGTHTFTYYSFDTGSRQHQLTVSKGSRVVTAADGDEIAEETPPASRMLTAEFQLGATWDGGYSGEFQVHNQTEREVGAWLLEFELAADARAAEVWPSDQHQLVSLGGGRWRVSCDTPIPASTTARVGVRVEPSGKAKTHPSNPTAREKDQ